jgi:hypothetical protein
MKKLIALILISLVIPIQSASAQEPLTDGFGKVYPKYITFDKPTKSMVINYPSVGATGLAEFNITMINTGLNISAIYFGLNEPCSTKYHGSFIKESFVPGFGPSTRTKTIQFLTQHYGYNCPEVILNITVVLVGQDISTGITQRILIPTNYYFILENANKAKAEADAKAKAEAEAKANPVVTPWIETHIQDINKITEGWKKATEALEANQRLQAEIKAKAEAEAKAKANAAWAAEVAERDRAYNALNEKIRQEFLKYEAQQLRKSIGKPCKTLGKFKENEAGYLQCISKKGKKVWGYLSLYNV